MLTVSKPGWIAPAVAKTKTISTLLIIPATVAVVSAGALFMGGILASAVLTATVFSVSLVFALLNFGMPTMVKVRDFISGYPKVFGVESSVCNAGILDLTQTILLTIVGFSLGGVTLAVSFLFLGLHLSSLFAIMRLWACLVDADKMTAYQAEMSAS